MLSPSLSNQLPSIGVGLVLDSQILAFSKQLQSIEVGLALDSRIVSQFGVDDHQFMSMETMLLCIRPNPLSK